MFNPLSIEAPYDCLQFINNLPAYNVNAGVDEMLDLIREIQESGNYYWQGIVFPGGQQSLVPGQVTINGTIQVPPGTYITSMTHFSDQPEGFKALIYDKGSKASIFYPDYAKDVSVSSDMQQPNNIYGLEFPFGPNYLLSPFIITGPGVLGWELVNLSANPANMQMMLAAAIPITPQSIGHVIGKRG